MKLLKQITTLFFCCLVLFFTGWCHAEESKPYTVFIVPQFTPVELHKAWTPILDKLSQATGFQFELKIFPTIPEFEHAIFTGEADFAFMNPYHEVVAKRTQGYIPLVRDEKSLEGILLVKKDSPIKTLSELNNQKIAFPAPNAFAACLYIRALLAHQGINITPDYVKSHSNVYRAIVLGDVVAGGSVNNIFQRELESIQQQLRVFYTTPKFAPHPFSAHPRITEAVRNQVISSFLKLAADPANAALLNAIQIPKPIAADYVKDYQPLEALDLERFFVKESP
jgi:phosphonate transport system substrate-binding protein